MDSFASPAYPLTTSAGIWYGDNTKANTVDQTGTAIGNEAQARSSFSTALGSNAQIRDGNSTASTVVGESAYIETSTFSTVVGEAAYIERQSDRSTVVGALSNVTRGMVNSSILGYNSWSLELSNIIIGSEAIGAGAQAILIGNATFSRGPQSIAIGTKSGCNVDNGLAIGENTFADTYVPGTSAGIDLRVTKDSLGGGPPDPPIDRLRIRINGRIYTIALCPDT